MYTVCVYCVYLVQVRYEGLTLPVLLSTGCNVQVGHSHTLHCHITEEISVKSNKKRAFCGRNFFFLIFGWPPSLVEGLTVNKFLKPIPGFS